MSTLRNGHVALSILGVQGHSCYFRVVFLFSVQVLGLLRGAGDAALGRRQAVQVAVSTLGAMLGHHPEEAQRDVLRPLLQPLTDALSDKGTGSLLVVHSYKFLAILEMLLFLLF